MTTQIGELCVCFVAIFALERFDRRMDVFVLLAARFAGKCFATIDARIGTGTFVMLPDVSS